MTERNTLMKRLAAGVGAFALATVGFLGVGTAAQADEPEIGNIVGTTGSLTIHKYAGDPIGSEKHDGSELETPLNLDPLKGVQFTIWRVGQEGHGLLDLTTVEGWNLAEVATAAGVESSPWTLDLVGAYDTDEDGVVSLSDLQYGLYLVKETNPGPNQIVSPVVPFLVAIPYPTDAGTWTYDVHVYPKNKLNETEPQKEVEDPGQALVAGDTLTYTIEAPVPPIASGDTYKKFEVVDTLDPRLTITAADVTVTSDGTALTSGDYTITVDGQKVTVALTGTGLGKIAAEDVITVVLKPTVNDDVTGTGEIVNEAIVNVNDTSIGTDPATVYYGAIEITKVNAADPEQLLDGAEFELYDAKGGTQVGTTTYTTVNGKVQIDSVWVGEGEDTGPRTYWLKETKAPAGYVTPDQDRDAAWTEVSVSGGATAQVTLVTVDNVKHEGPKLPQTGSSATVIMMLVGLGLVGTAGALFAARRTRTSH